MERLSERYIQRLTDMNIDRNTQVQIKNTNTDLHIKTKTHKHSYNIRNTEEQRVTYKYKETETLKYTNTELHLKTNRLGIVTTLVTTSETLKNKQRVTHTVNIKRQKHRKT